MGYLNLFLFESEGFNELFWFTCESEREIYFNFICFF